MPSQPSYTKLSPSSSSSSSSLKAIRPISCDTLVSQGIEKPPPIHINDEIVWMSDDGPEFGKVKWVGKLPDQGDHWMAGVHFQNPIGTGLGEYNGVRLFETPLRHASLVPLIGLIKRSDFLMSSNDRPVTSDASVNHQSVMTVALNDSPPSSPTQQPSRPPRSKVKSSRGETYKFYTDNSDRSPVKEEAFVEKQRESNQEGKFFVLSLFWGVSNRP